MSDDIRAHEVGLTVPLRPDPNRILVRENQPISVWTNGDEFDTHKVNEDWVLCYGAWRFRKPGRAQRVA